MRILYYSPSPFLRLDDPAGYGTHMREMIGAFRSLGHEVIPLIMGDEGHSLPGEGKEEGITAKKLAKSVIPSFLWESLRDISLIRSDKKFKTILARKISELSPDWIYERANTLQRSGLDAAMEAGIPHILEINGPMAEEKENLSGQSLFSKSAGTVERYLLQNTKHVVVVSSVLKNFFAKKYSLDGSKFVVTPNAVNPEKIKTNAEHMASIVRQYSLSDKTVIGFSGSIFPWHGVDLLLEAFDAIRKKYPETHLLIVGDGEVLPQLKRKAEVSEWKNRVHFTGNVPHQQVFDYLSCMDICVMARSNWYGSPVKIFEYGALGKAVIAPDTGPVQEVMGHRKDGLLVSPDVRKITEALETLISNVKLRQEYGNAFRTKIFKEHTWNANALKVLEVMKKEGSISI